MSLNGRSSLAALFRRRRRVADPLDAERRRSAYDRALAELLDRLLPPVESEGATGCAVAFVDAEPGRGASAAAANLAVHAAKRRRLRTLLLDADEKSPSQHRRFQTAASPGLVNVFSGEVALEDAVQATVYGRLDVLPFGEGSIPFDAATLAAFREALNVARTQYLLTLVVLSGTGHSGWTSLAAAVDRCVLVADAERSRRSRLEESASRLRSAGATLVGTVLDRCDPY